mmetsp:Transcript_32954/g.71843  ORF Transcript_32954/g.71843 Transcript_32954/m.71843 type:complete len:221 (+) Transcript_32954:423-1085(+)
MHAWCSLALCNDVRLELEHVVAVLALGALLPPALGHGALAHAAGGLAGLEGGEDLPLVVVVGGFHRLARAHQRHLRAVLNLGNGGGDARPEETLNLRLAGLELLEGARVVKAHDQGVAPARHLLAQRGQDGGVLAPDTAGLADAEHALEGLVQVLLVSVPVAGGVLAHLDLDLGGLIAESERRLVGGDRHGVELRVLERGANQADGEAVDEHHGGGGGSG